jgi:hypothetical protein
MKSIKKMLIILLSGLVLILSMASCYGKFGLTKKVYQLNGRIGNQSTKLGGVINSVFMIVMVIIPIYGISALLDIIVFNLIEFWSGSNPVAGNDNDDQNLINTAKVQMVREGTFNERIRITVKSEKGIETFYAFQDKPGIFFVKVDGKYHPVEVKSIDENGITTINLHSKGFDRTTAVKSLDILNHSMAMESRINERQKEKLASIPAASFSL